MTIWQAREAAAELLAGPLTTESDLLASLFQMIEHQVASFERVDSPLARASAAILGKAHRLSVGLYSLQLDALGQESGALLRPLQEVSELLSYLAYEPTRVDEVIEGRLPKPGVIAQRIDGRLKALRDHLSAHASHFAVTPEAVAHYVDFERGVVHLDRRPSAKLLRRNVRGLAAFMVMCAADGATLLAHAGLDSAEQMDRLSSVRDELVSNHQARKV